MSVGILKEIWRYPVKSMAGERINQCTIIETYGIPGDRGWAVWDETAGEIRGAKKIPALLECAARYSEEPIGVEVPSAQIELPDGRVLSSDDPFASQSLSQLLKRKVRLCDRRPAEEDPAHYRRAEPIVDVDAEIRDTCGLLPDEPLPELGDVTPEMLEFVSPPGTYFDAFPLHLITTASLAELERLAPASQMDVRRFRPNLLIETPPHVTGFAEFDWCGRELRIGAMRARIDMPMMRCSMTTWSQGGLPKDPSIMRVLVKEARQNLGMALTVTAAGPIAVGDRIELE